MAQLKDLLVSGASRLIGKLFVNEAQITTLDIPTTAGGTTYGPGTSGNYLRTNGTSVYWDALDSSDIPNLDAGKITTGTLPVTRGGTGLSSLTSGSALIGNGANAVSLRAITNNTSATAVTASTNLITANTLYYHKGNSNIVTVGTISSGTWQGTTVGVGYGGTGKTSWTKYGVLYADTTTSLTNTAAGTAGQVLQSGGGSAAPSWLSQSSITAGKASALTDLDSNDAASSTATQRYVWISYDNNTTGRPATTSALTFQTSTGTLTATKFSGDGSGLTSLNAGNISSGTLPVARGGTNATSVTKYGVAYGNSSADGYAFTAAGTSGYLLQSGGGSSAPSWIQATNANTASTIVKRDSSGNFSAGTITATLSGNASTATKFASAQSVTLTGDVTGTASSQAGWSVATTLANSGVTAASYGPSADASPAHSGTFSVPYITVDAKGRITAASTKTITLPADSDTHYTSKNVVGSSTATSNTTTALTNGNVYLNSVENGAVTSAHKISGSGATSVTSDVSGNIIVSSTDNNTVPSGDCTTGASTAAKTATFTRYALRANSYFQINMQYSNTSAGALTLAINGTAAKPIYINGTVSSASNYTLPAGPYIVFYDGTNYHFRTDDKIPGYALNGYNVYSSTVDATNTSTMYVAGTLSSDASYKQLKHNTAVTISSGKITAGDFIYSADDYFTQAAIDALYPSSASSSIDIPASLVVTVNQRLNTQDGIISGLSTSVTTLSNTIGTVPANTTVQGQINTINTNISTINSRLTFGALTSVVYYQATSTNYENVGLSVSIPSGKTGLVSFEVWWSTGAPMGIIITNSTATPSGSNIIHFQEVTSTANVPRRTPILYLPGGNTYYMWIKRGSVPTDQNGHIAYGAIL